VGPAASDVNLERFALTGKVALVTGGTGAMGSDFCRGLAGAGADLVVVSRDRAKQSALRGEIEDLGRAYHSIPCDLSDLGAVAAMAHEAWDAFGHVDVIVHNAMSHGDGHDLGVADLTESALDYQLTVTMKSAWIMFQILCPKMVAGNGGSVITVSSTAGIVPTRGLLAYGIGKAALIMLTKYVAQEFGPAVRANVLNPGVIKTADTGNFAQLSTTMIPRIAAGRLGRSDECVGLIIYLASDASSYTSGQVITIDGGRF
jgi:NAD(P)-dependent dehydrogenase (short-subunit alcohol dehydrogenase family)